MALFWALYWVSCRWAGASVASVASGAVLATAGTHRGAAPQLGNSRAPGRAAPQQQQRQLRPQGIIQHYSLLSIRFIHLCASVSQCVCPYSTQSIARPADRRAEHAWRAESFGSGRDYYIQASCLGPPRLSKIQSKDKKPYSVLFWALFLLYTPLHVGICL